MVTTVGTERAIEDLIKNLLLLEHDAIAAYEATIKRLDDTGKRARVEAFRQDHLRHVDQLRHFAEERGIDAPSEGDMKEILTTGKVILAGLAGDSALLKAMKTNEDDTVQAYEEASRNALADASMKPMFVAALEDERRHRA